MKHEQRCSRPGKISRFFRGSTFNFLKVCLLKITAMAAVIASSNATEGFCMETVKSQFTPQLGVSLRAISTPLTAEAIELLRHCSIRTLELCPELFAATDGDALKQKLKAVLEQGGPRAVSWHVPYGIDYDLSSPDEKVRVAAVQRIRVQAQEASAFGCRILVVHPGREPFPQTERALRLQIIRRSLAELRDDLHAHKQQLALEMLPRDCMGYNIDELFTMLEGADDTFGICLDVNHYMGQFSRLPDDVRRCGKKLLTLHLSDYDGIDERHWLPEAGRGVVKWEQFMAALIAISYQGPFNLECRMTEKTPAERLAALEKCYADFLMPLYRKAAAAGAAAIVCTEQRKTEILLMDSTRPWDAPEAVLWRWSPLEAADIPKPHKGWFSNVSECKWVLNGEQVMVTASGGAVALVRISDKKVMFYALAGGNTHSAELLPDGNIVAAASTGNFLKILIPPVPFTTPENVKEVTIPYSDTHGVVWDRRQQLLWVLGGAELTAFKYNFDRQNPQLTQAAVFRPGPDDFHGHDLFPVAGTDSLFLTGVYKHLVLEFNTVTHQFKTLRESAADVKSVTLNPATGEIIYQSPSESWWTDTILSFDGKRRTLPGARFYKARWFIPNSFSY